MTPLRPALLAATVLYGSLFADGFESAGTGAWSVAMP